MSPFSISSKAVERLEKEATRRREEVEVFQSRFTSPAKDGQNWRNGLRTSKDDRAGSQEAGRG